MKNDLISRSQLYGIESLLMTDIVANDPTAKFVLEQVLYDIEHIEAADDVEVIHGLWEFTATGYQCSKCLYDSLYDGWNHPLRSNYCPNCGVKMDLEEIQYEK